MTNTDFLGGEYGPGDIVLYAAGSGRCIYMVLAGVVEIKENGNVVVQPLVGSRWSRQGDIRYKRKKVTLTVTENVVLLEKKSGE